MAFLKGVLVLVIVVLATIVILLTSKIRLFKFQKKTAEIQSTSLSDNRTLPSSLRRLDKDEIPANPSSTPKLIQEVFFKNTFNAIDEDGKYFSHGIFQTTSGTFIASGFVKNITKDQGIIFYLVDEFGEEINPPIKIPSDKATSFPVGTRNTNLSLDLKQPLSVSNKDVLSLSASLINSKVVFELTDYEKGDKLVFAKTLYIK